MSLCGVLSRVVLGLALAGVPWHAAHATSADSDQARGYFDKASASFALGHYAVAAENYEKAFEAKPDPALLYNAAQAHRLAGDKERALVLYQNYLRLYTRAFKRTEVEARIEELKKAIERDREVATSPPTTTMPATSMPAGGGVEPVGPPGPPPPAPETPPAGVAAAPAVPSVVESRTSMSTSASTPVLVAQPDPGATEKRSLTQKPLFWAAVGGGVAAVIAVVLVIALGGTKDPSPSLGVVK